MDNNENEEMPTTDDISAHECLQVESREDIAASEQITPNFADKYFPWIVCSPKEPVTGFRCQPFKKWPFTKKTIIILGVILVILNIGISVAGGMAWRAWRLCDPNKSPTSPLGHVFSCPKSWVGYEGRCYYFSSAEGTWDYSQSQCSSLGASLASIDTQQEMDFIMRYKIDADHWFGLRRKEERKPWKWLNGSDFNNWFNIRARGFCAYLNDEGPFSTRCDTSRNWICSKPLQSYPCEKMNCLVPER